MTELVAVDSQNSKLEAAGLAWRNTESGDVSWHRLRKVKFSLERHFRLGVPSTRKRSLARQLTMILGW